MVTDMGRRCGVGTAVGGTGVGGIAVAVGGAGGGVAEAGWDAGVFGAVVAAAAMVAVARVACAGVATEAVTVSGATVGVAGEETAVADDDAYETEEADASTTVTGDASGWQRRAGAWSRLKRNHHRRR